jgi:prevent-host-death family protein
VKTTYSITEAQAKLPSLVREVATREAFSITRHGETIAYLISRERLDAVLETIEVLSNPDAMKALDQYKHGRTKFTALEALDEGTGTSG